MDAKEKQLEIAVNAVEQQITLATVIIGACLALSDQLTGVKQGRVWDLLPIAFAPLAASVVFGILLLQSISFDLGKEREPFKQGLVRGFGIAQNVTFMLSVCLMLVVIWIA